MINETQEAVRNMQGFSLSGLYGSVANSVMINYAFKTPKNGKMIHLKINDIQSSVTNKVRIDFYEAPDVAPINGSDVVAYNHYRAGEPLPSSMQAIKLNATLDMTGATMLDYHYISTVKECDWILKPDTWYIRMISNQTGGAIDVSFYEFWLEV